MQFTWVIDMDHVPYFCFFLFKLNSFMIYNSLISQTVKNARFREQGHAHAKILLALLEKPKIIEVGARFLAATIFRSK